MVISLLVFAPDTLTRAPDLSDNLGATWARSDWPAVVGLAALVGVLLLVGLDKLLRTGQVPAGPTGTQ